MTKREPRTDDDGVRTGQVAVVVVEVPRNGDAADAEAELIAAFVAARTAQVRYRSARARLRRALQRHAETASLSGKTSR